MDNFGRFSFENVLIVLAAEWIIFTHFMRYIHSDSRVFLQPHNQIDLCLLCLHYNTYAMAVVIAYNVLLVE